MRIRYPGKGGTQSGRESDEAGKGGHQRSHPVGKRLIKNQQSPLPSPSARSSRKVFSTWQDRSDPLWPLKLLLPEANSLHRGPPSPSD